MMRKLRKSSQLSSGSLQTTTSTDIINDAKHSMQANSVMQNAGKTIMPNVLVNTITTTSDINAGINRNVNDVIQNAGKTIMPNVLVDASKAKYLISVIVPCYNKFTSIDVTMESLINQTIFPKLEIIVVDDCSTDKSVKKLAQYEKRYKNIKLFKMAKNSSVFSVRKLGIKEATANYIGFIDMDDRVDPGYYEELYNAIEPDVDIIQTFSVYKDYGDGDIRNAKKSYYKVNNNCKITTDVNNAYFVKMITTNWNTLWNRLFKASVIKPITGFPNYYINFLEDIAVLFITYMNSNVIKTYNTNAYYYYNLSDKVTHLTTSKQREVKAESTVKTFHIINYYIMFSRHFEYYQIIKQFRQMYLDLFARNTAYRLSFNFGKSVLTAEELRDKVINDRYKETFMEDDDDVFDRDDIEKMQFICENFIIAA